MQLIQISKEELEALIRQSVREEIKTLKKELTPNEPKEYLTRKQVAQQFKVDVSTIHNWCKKEILTPYSIGARVYFKSDEIEAALIKLNTSKK